ncbi:uncharacterized protein PSFLO_01870 [Pseudozyma flocculosa]|uniref:Uncharacterized protein n=1 Tax=Pseudozyma flocculosa TaxID=84751 RepID=A0A5C3EZ19_9BASI|nr:uncharacterized protein PSFLO_01870 [Pseudozyma flocculosa]
MLFAAVAEDRLVGGSSFGAEAVAGGLLAYHLPFFACSLVRPPRDFLIACAPLRLSRMKKKTQRPSSRQLVDPTTISPAQRSTETPGGLGTTTYGIINVQLIRQRASLVVRIWSLAREAAVVR